MNLYDRLEKREPDMKCFYVTIVQVLELVHNAPGTFELIGAFYKFGFLLGQRAERAERKREYEKRHL